MNSDSGIPVPAHIFKAYDIRGIVGEDLTPSHFYLIGQAFGSECTDTIEDEVFVACDARLSSPELKAAVIEGVTSIGLNVADLGTVPTPLLYFAVQNSQSGTGLMVTASHNPPNYNGVKLVLAKHPFYGDEIQQLRQRILLDRLTQRPKGKITRRSVVESYRQAISTDVCVSRPVKVVIDCANGVGGSIAPQILRDIGCEVIELYCDVDGSFPNHSPDPTKPDNLKDLVSLVLKSQADVGLAIDGDGDRLVAVSPQGNIIWPDKLMILFARKILANCPGGQVVFDVKCERSLAREVSKAGGVPVLWKTGHSLIRAKMIECDAIFAGEMSGHFYFKDRWSGFDDGIYAAARLCELLSGSSLNSGEIFETLPSSSSTPEIRVRCDVPHAAVEEFGRLANFGDAKLISIDGLRADFEDGFGLIRASNTAPEIVFRFDADNEASLTRIQNLFFGIWARLLDCEGKVKVTQPDQPSTSMESMDR